TYKELNERSNKLGHYLRSVGVKEETLVPIYIERSLEIVIGILGILKAGAAYVPVDTDYPLERINFMLKDTGASVAVGSKKSSLKVKAGEDLHVIKLDEEFPGLLEQPSTHVPSSLSPNNLCYVIYTSGSTGQPKGVLIEHKSLLDYLFGLKQTVSIDHCNSFALLATLATDLGNTILYSSLISGGILHLFSYEKINDFHFLHKYFNEHSIECLKIVPSHWKALSDGDNLLLPLKLLIFGGEALGSDVINNIITAGFNGQIINHYGPTETTIGKLLYTINPFDNYKNSIPIGKSFSNSRVYVITKNNQICPIGISGEICISGDGLARGYLNHEDLTRDKFVNNPFSKDGSKMYRTGDKGRWLPDGNIEFLGRFDDQVKIHGFRIELGEVETVIQQSELVKQAVVLARKDNQGNNGLIGYIVPAGSLNREALKDYLKYKLPEYMIPAKWVELERLPLTLNGKIDKKALPDFDAGEVLNENYVAPRNEIERKLAEIWKQVLDIEKVGVHNNFFELGGDSLLAIRLLSSIRKELVVEMPISDVFDYPTIASFVESLSGQITPSSFSTLEAQPRPDIIPLSFGQERFWFLQQLHGGVQYHISYVLRLKGNLHKEGVEYALQTLVNRHEILRTVIRSHNGLVHQIIKDKNTWQLSISEGVQYANKRLELKQYIGELISKPFNLSEDNLLRATLITLSEQENLLVATLHHIASDGWSESIMVKELVQLYNTFRKGDAVYLPELKLQYADFAIWQRNHYQGDWLSSKLLYWRNKLKGIASLQLPADYLRPPIQSTSGAGVDFDIDKKLLSGLQQLSHQHGVTLFMTLVSVFKVMLHRYTGQEDIPVGIPIANRNRKEVEELIGFFVNTLVLRSEVNSNKVFIEFLQQIKTTTLEAYDHQEVPFEKVVEAVVKERDPSRNPLFQVMFVMQNVPPIPGVGLADVEVLVEDYERKTSKFDLTFIITKTPVGLKASVEYCTDLFSEQTILRMIGHYKELLGSIVKQPYEKIGMLSMLKATEEHQLLVGFNDTAAEYPKDKTILDLFEEQAAGTPEAIALVFEQQQLTYLELNERCNQLAHYLRSKGVKEETLVPICIERSVEMIIGILGILKAGGAYVPIDPEYPDERIAYMMEDTGAKMVLSSKKNRSTLQSLIGVEIIELDLDWSVISKQSSSNLQIDIQPHHLAYVIYTSGSTGKPKGVMIEHGSLAASTITRNSYYKYVGSILLIPSFSFDSSVAVIFWAVSTGGRLIISKEQSIKDTH
ncbi:MAG: amino acid adenylation domain-containing protein, partial [Chitinophagaceae bacterium]